MSDPFNPYKELYANPQGVGDARPTALQVIRDEDLVNKWTGRVVLVTGATSGIGVETARALHGTGADVYITARDDARGQRVAADLRGTSEGSGKVGVVHMDMASLVSVRQAAEEFLAKSGGRLNVLVNNAGTYRSTIPSKHQHTKARPSRSREHLSQSPQA
jgi:NAD(P)-dependent dehydrogenase (short-subunit alcohol dehydrogenase family)